MQNLLNFFRVFQKIRRKYLTIILHYHELLHLNDIFCVNRAVPIEIERQPPLKR